MQRVLIVFRFFTNGFESNFTLLFMQHRGLFLLPKGCLIFYESESKMNKLFERSTINGMTLSNRFVRSATWEGMAGESGECTPRLINLLAELARGGVGLIISSHTYVSPEGQASPWQLGVFKDDLITGLEALAKAVHENGGKIVMQLAHAGIAAASKLTGITPWAPSNLEGFWESAHKEMTFSDIQDVVDAFAAGAERAQKTGFDGIQIHAAHGYLISQFLSPYFNQRNDEYGGSIENRARILLEVVRAVRATVGNGYPVLVKLNCQDFHDNGLSLDDSVRAGIMLAGKGIDAIELSGGNRIAGKLGPVRAGINSAEKEAYFQSEAKSFKKKVTVPLIIVGGNRSLQVAERLVNEGVADYISMSRPLIREPHLINRWKAGDLTKSACVSDNLCYRPATKGNGIYCLTEERERKRKAE
jgi:2,4-dienoyl-CoA reductase-like NADH-dependent reductase (Old Yellow Enzyme family)